MWEVSTFNINFLRRLRAMKTKPPINPLNFMVSGCASGQESDKFVRNDQRSEMTGNYLSRGCRDGDD